jgi:hypothetical protein
VHGLRPCDLTISWLGRHPMQSLCTLRGRRYRRLTQHSLPSGPLRPYSDRSFTGWTTPAILAPSHIASRLSAFGVLQPLLPSSVTGGREYPPEQAYPLPLGSSAGVTTWPTPIGAAGSATAMVSSTDRELNAVEIPGLTPKHSAPVRRPLNPSIPQRTVPTRPPRYRQHLIAREYLP